MGFPGRRDFLPAFPSTEFPAGIIVPIDSGKGYRVSHHTGV
jgi:hypothetical protein